MQNDYQEILNNVKLIARDGISSIAYETWISQIDIFSIEGNKITLLVPSSFFADQIRPYEPLLINCFKQVIQKDCQISYIASDTLETMRFNISCR